MTEIIIKDQIKNNQGMPFTGQVKILKTDNKKSNELQILNVENGEFSCIVEPGVYGVQYIPKNTAKPFSIQETWRIPKSSSANKSIVYKITDVIKNNNNYNSKLKELYNERDFKRLENDISKLNKSLETLSQKILDTKGTTHLEGIVSSLSDETEELKEGNKKTSYSIKKLESDFKYLDGEFKYLNKNVEEFFSYIENQIVKNNIEKFDPYKVEKLSSKINSLENNINTIYEDKDALRETNKRIDIILDSIEECNNYYYFIKNTIISDRAEFEERLIELKESINNLQSQYSMTNKALTYEKSERQRAIDKFYKKLDENKHLSENLDNAIHEINSLKSQGENRQKEFDRFVEYVENRFIENDIKSENSNNLIPRIEAIEENMNSINDEIKNIREVYKRLDSLDKKVKHIDTLKKSRKEIENKLSEEVQIRELDINKIKEKLNDLAEIPEGEEIKKLKEEIEYTKLRISEVSELSYSVIEKVEKQYSRNMELEEVIDYVDNQIAQVVVNSINENDLEARIDTVEKRTTYLIEDKVTIREINKRLDLLEDSIKGISNETSEV